MALIFTFRNLTFEEFVGEDVQGNDILLKAYLDTNRICPQKLTIPGKELSMPDPWLRVLEWKSSGENSTVLVFLKSILVRMCVMGGQF